MSVLRPDKTAAPLVVFVKFPLPARIAETCPLSTAKLVPVKDPFCRAPEATRTAPTFWSCPPKSSVPSATVTFPAPVRRLCRTNEPALTVVEPV